jgi:hypothetical protein
MLHNLPGSPVLIGFIGIRAPVRDCSVRTAAEKDLWIDNAF